MISGTVDSKMFAIGERLPGVPYLMKYENISNHHVSFLAKGTERLLQSEYNMCLNDIRQKENDGNLIGNKNMHALGKYTRTFDMSYNLSNPAHLDNGDISSGVSIWLRRKSCNPTSEMDNWWFVLPNLTTEDGKKGIAIELSNGLAIQWDGRKVKHCTAIPSVPKEDSFIGAFFSAKKKFLN